MLIVPLFINVFLLLCSALCKHFNTHFFQYPFSLLPIATLHLSQLSVEVILLLGTTVFLNQIYIMLLGYSLL